MNIYPTNQMNRKVLITILTILGLAIIAGGFWYVKSQQKENVVIKEKQEQNRQMNNEKENGNQKQEEQKNEKEDDKESDFKKIDTSNWKTYRNKEYGFEFKYPESWEIEEEYQANYLYKELLIIVKPTDQEKYKNLRFGVGVFTSNESPSEWYKNNFGIIEGREEEGISIKKLEINGNKAFYVRSNSTSGSVSNYVISIRDNLILNVYFKDRRELDNPKFQYQSFIPYFEVFVNSIK